MPGTLYFDGFRLHTNFAGGTLVFDTVGITPDGAPANHGVGAIVSAGLPVIKLLAYACWQQVRELETAQGVDVPVSPVMLNDNAIGLEDWEAFWRR